MDFHSTEPLDMQRCLTEGIDPNEDPFSFDRSANIPLYKYLYIPIAPQNPIISANISLLSSVQSGGDRIEEVREAMDLLLNEVDPSSLDINLLDSPYLLMPLIPIKEKKKKKKGKNLWPQEEEKNKS